MTFFLCMEMELAFIGRRESIAIWIRREMRKKENNFCIGSIAEKIDLFLSFFALVWRLFVYVYVYYMFAS